MKTLLAGSAALLLLAAGRPAAAQQPLPAPATDYLDSTGAVLPSASGATYRRLTEYRDSVAGERRTYYLSGELRQRQEFAHLRKGVPHGVGETYARNGQRLSHFEYDHGRYVGELLLYYPTGQLRRRETYDRPDHRRTGECFAPDGQPVAFFPYEVMPRYPRGNGGPGAVVQAITRNFHYPPDAQRQGIRGRVLVGFTITEQGTVADITVLQPLFPSIDAEAVRAVSQLERFTPAQQDGKPVRIHLTAPLSLRQY